MKIQKPSQDKVSIGDFVFKIEGNVIRKTPITKVEFGGVQYRDEGFEFFIPFGDAIICDGNEFLVGQNQEIIYGMNRKFLHAATLLEYFRRY